MDVIMAQLKSQNTSCAASIVNTLLGSLNIRYEMEAPLGPLTWYGVGGRAAALVHPASVHQLSTLVSACCSQQVPIYVLGAGANLLVADEGVDGIVVHLDELCWRQVRMVGQAISVGAGYDLMKLVMWTAREGLSGIQSLAGIPATVGGAVRMNAGGTFGQIGTAIRRIQVMSADGLAYTRERDELVFDYRTSNIVEPFILEVEFDLNSDDPHRLVQELKEVFIYKKKSQPLAKHSAGCAFKNPPPCDDGQRYSAGALIDRSGLKGHRIGGAQLSDIHANFIVTHDGCTAGDILALMDHVKRRIADCFGIYLEREVVVWQ